MSDRPVLPMRFGSVLRDEAAVLETLAVRHAELTDALRRVSGAVELGVRAAWDPEAATEEDAPAGGPRGPGATYLLELARSRQRARALADRLDRSVAGLSRTRVRRLLASPNLPVSGAYLVDRGGVDAFRRRVAMLDAEVEEAEIVCTGPWPRTASPELRHARRCAASTAGRSLTTRWSGWERRS